MAYGPTEPPADADHAGKEPHLPRLWLLGTRAKKGELRARPDGGAEVPMRCEACEGVSDMALVLSPEEAEALGLHSLGERPQEAP